MALTSRRTRVATKAARTGIQTYGEAKRLQGRADARRVRRGRTSERRTSEGHGLLGLGAGVALGAAVAYLLDPADGRRRRHVARDRTAAMMRRRTRDAANVATDAANRAKGAMHEATPSSGGPPPNDVALARKVETEIFRPPEVPKGKVSVDAAEGVVHLRGEVEEQWIAELVRSAERVDGVARVENLLHPPGTPAPRRAPTTT